MFNRYNFKIKSFSNSTITFDNNRVIRKSDIAIKFKNVKSHSVTGSQNKKLAGSAFQKLPRTQTPHPPRRLGDIANFQPPSLSSLNPTLTPEDTTEFDYVPHHFSVDSFQKRQLPCNSGAQIPGNSGEDYTQQVDDFQEDQSWYAAYQTNASDMQFASDPNLFYNPLENEIYCYYPQSSSAPPLYPDPFPSSQMMLNESNQPDQSQELFNTQGSNTAEQPAEIYSSYPATSTQPERQETPTQDELPTTNPLMSTVSETADISSARDMATLADNLQTAQQTSTSQTVQQPSHSQQQQSQESSGSEIASSRGKNKKASSGEPKRSSKRERKPPTFLNEVVTHRIEEQSEGTGNLEGSESSGRSVNYNAIRNATEEDLKEAIQEAKRKWSKDEASSHKFDRFLLSLDKKRKNKSPTKKTSSKKHPKVQPTQVPASKPSSSFSQSEKKNLKPKRARIVSSSEDE